MADGWQGGIGLRIDLSAFERKAAEMNAFADQVPFALSKALNEAAVEARKAIVKTWEEHVKVRRQHFIHQVLHLELSSKRNLRVAYYDQTKDQRGHLKLHAEGGTKVPKGEHLAIPYPKNPLIRMTGAGLLPRAMRPKALIASTPKQALRFVKLKSGNVGVFVGGAVQTGHLELFYTLVKQARIHATVPFEQTWEQVITRELHAQFPRFLEQAMKTRIASKYAK